MSRAARQLVYVSILIDLTGIDRAEIAARPPDEQFLVLLHALEERGVTLDDVAGWTAICDPEGGPEPPAGDPIECFRSHARAALHEPPTLLQTVVVAAALGFGGIVAARRLAR